LLTNHKLHNAAFTVFSVLRNKAGICTAFHWVESVLTLLSINLSTYAFILVYQHFKYY